MKLKLSFGIFLAGLIITIAASNFISVGERLDDLRGSVLRIHILANSDSREDQQLKLYVRDTLLKHSYELFGNCETLDGAVADAGKNLGKACEIAENAVRCKGYNYKVNAEITDMYFTERTYGKITMPAGKYKALRITIGEAKGHNWWCVMYPPLCIPAASEVNSDEDAEKIFFTPQQQDIMNNPQKYKVRFMIWDKIKGNTE
jgi:stage II sporulation protein R